MKFFLHIRKLLIFIILIFSGTTVFGQLNINTASTPAQLVQNVLIQGGLSISNVTYKGNTGGATSQFGYFTNGNTTNLGLTSGVVMATGYVPNIPGAASTSGGMSDHTGSGSDADLNTVIGSSGTEDACVLEFDFIPTANTVSFRYVFASEEYPNYVCSSFNDVFGFFLSGPGITGTYTNNAVNIALIPGTNYPVAINTVNSGSAGTYSTGSCPSYGLNYSSYYVNNSSGSTIVFGGFTKVLTATYNVTACQTYHIKLAIADVGDENYDSGVFLEANSFNAGPGESMNVQNAVSGNNTWEGCSSIITFTRKDTINNSSPDTVNYTLSGTATQGTDYNTLLPNPVIIPAGINSVSITLNAINDGITEGTETVIISWKGTSALCSPLSSDTIFLHDFVGVTAHIQENDTSICSGGSITLHGIVTAGNYYQYIWSSGGSIISHNQNITVSPTVPTDYYLTVKDSCGNVAKDTVSITISAGSVAATGASAAPTTICAGMSTTISVIGGSLAVGDSWQWCTGNCGGTVAGTGASITVSPVSNTTYYVRAVGSCDTTSCASVSVTVYPSPPAYAGADTATCDSVGIMLSATGGISYSWSPAATLNNPNIQNPIATPTSITTYVVTVTDANGCTASDDVTVSINALPNVTASPDTTVCSGASVSLNASGGISYSWSPAATLDNPNIQNPVATPTSTTIYIVTATGNNGCFATNSATVTVSPAPVPIISPSGQTGFCDSSSVNVTLNAGSGYTSYSWSTGETTQTIIVTQPGTYSVTVVDNNGCIGNSSGTNIYVEPPLIKPVILAASTPTFCEYDSVMLYLANTYYTYQWSSGSMTPHISAFETNDYIVTVTDSIGCVAVSDPFHVEVDPLPDAYASYSNHLLNVSFYDFSLYATSWNWDFGDSQSSTQGNPQHTYAAAGTYTVILTATNNCGSDYDTLVITVPGADGINNYANDLSGLLIYPVPVSDNVNVSFTAKTTDIDIMIYDILGKLIYSESLSNINGKYVKSINMAENSPGLYLLELKTNNSIIIKKFNKK